jgi:hypothetical protein
VVPTDLLAYCRSKLPRARTNILSTPYAKAPSATAPKARGVKLDNPKIEAARDKAIAAIEAGVDRTAANALPIIAQIRRSGATTLRAVAAALNARGVPTSRGGQWHAIAVRNVLARSNLS